MTARISSLEDRMAASDWALGDPVAKAIAAERRRCVKIVRDSLDGGEYERSLRQSIIKHIYEQ